MTSIGSLLCVHMSGWSRAAPPSFLSQKKAFEKIHPLTSFSHLRFVGGTAAAPKPSLSLAHVSLFAQPSWVYYIAGASDKTSGIVTQHNYVHIHTHPATEAGKGTRLYRTCVPWRGGAQHTGNRLDCAPLPLRNLLQRANGRKALLGVNPPFPGFFPLIFLNTPKPGDTTKWLR